LIVRQPGRLDESSVGLWHPAREAICMPHIMQSTWRRDNRICLQRYLGMQTASRPISTNPPGYGHCPNDTWYL